MRRTALALGMLLLVGAGFFLWRLGPMETVPSMSAAPGSATESDAGTEVVPAMQELIAPSLPPPALEVDPATNPSPAVRAPAPPRAPHLIRLEAFVQNATRWNAYQILHDGAVAALHRAGSYTELAEGESLLTRGDGTQMFTQLNLQTGRQWVYPVRPGDFPLLDRTIAVPVDELLDPNEARALADEVAAWFDGRFAAPSYAARDYLIAR